MNDAEHLSMTPSSTLEGDLNARLHGEVPLTFSETFIRVLDLLPGRRHQQVEVILRVVDLADRPTYTALSYTRGASELGHSITANESHTLPVTDNLFNALVRSRRKYRKRTLWVDRVCTNQLDTHERSRQVALMGKIFGQAESVDVWIGEPVSGPLIDWRQLHWKKIWFFLDSFVHDRDSRRSLACAFELIRAFLFSVRHHPARLQSAIDSTTPSWHERAWICLLYTSPSPRDGLLSRMPSSA